MDGNSGKIARWKRRPDEIRGLVLRTHLEQPVTPPRARHPPIRPPTHPPFWRTSPRATMRGMSPRRPPIDVNPPVLVPERWQSFNITWNMIMIIFHKNSLLKNLIYIVFFQRNCINLPQYTICYYFQQISKKKRYKFVYIIAYNMSNNV